MGDTESTPPWTFQETWPRSFKGLEVEPIADEPPALHSLLKHGPLTMINSHFMDRGGFKLLLPEVVVVVA